MAGGRPSKYDPKYCQEIIDYFADAEPYREVKIVTTGKEERESGGYKRVETKEVANDPRFISGFAHSIGVGLRTLYDWADEHDEFSHALKRAREAQERYFVINGMKGLYASAPFIFSMKNMFKWRDHRGTTIELPGEGDGNKDTVISIRQVMKDYAPKNRIEEHVGVD